MKIFEKIIDAAQFRYGIFRYNYRWSDYTSLIDGRLARLSLAIPIVGYLIIFNDYIAQHISFNILTSDNDISWGLSSLLRLKLLYLGLVIIGSANIVYYLRRPHSLKLGRTETDYINYGLRYFGVYNFITIHNMIRTKGHLTMAGKYYDSEYDAFLELAVGKDTGRHYEKDARSINWKEARDRYEHLLRSMLEENYFRSDTGRRFSLSVCIALALIGYVLLAIPSVDLFIKVLTVVFKGL